MLVVAAQASFRLFTVFSANMLEDTLWLLEIAHSHVCVLLV